MQKQLFCAIMLLCTFGVTNSQHLIRVNNNENADADYTNLQDANDNAMDGDTLYVEGSPTAYDMVQLSKKLTIIGPGYFLNENEMTQANGVSANVNNIYFNPGSTGSIIMGLVTSDIYVAVNDLILVRCRIQDIYINSICDNILILQNYINNIQTLNSGIITNSIISNNLLNGIVLYSSSGSLQITNNVLIGSYWDHNISCYNASISDNIISYTTGYISTNTGNAINNNILATDGTNANGNQYNVVMANVFVDFNGTQGYSSDGKWQLKVGSPAIGAGLNGVDCGAFGGVSPYILSGIPALPHIYEANIPGTAYSDSGLSCTIKVKSGK